MVNRFSEDETVARKLISYERFSKGKQEAGASLDRQSELIQQAAKEEKLPIDNSISLRDKGVSAFRGKHWQKGDLGKFLDLVESGVIPAGSVLCVERVDRLGRMPWRMQIKLWEKILEKGIIIRTCVPPTRYTLANIDELGTGCPLAIAMMLAHEESKQKSERVSDALRRKRRRAMETGEPHGCRYPNWLLPISRPHPDNPDKRIVERWEVIQEREAIIRQMHQLAWDGDGAITIARKLNEASTPCWRKSGRWNERSILYHLRSRALIGESCGTVAIDKCPLGQRIVMTNYPEILTTDEYERTQRAIAGRRGKGGNQGRHGFSLFTGIVQDEQGTNLGLQYNFNRRGERHYYIGTPDHKTRLPYQRFEEAVVGLLRGLTVKDIDGSAHKDEWTERIAQIQGSVQNKRLALDSLDRQLKELPVEKWPARVVSRIADLESELAAELDQLREAKEAGNTSTRSEALVATQSMLGYLAGLTVAAERREVLTRLKKRIAMLISGIVVAVDGCKGRSKWVHIRVEYQGGHVDRYSVRIGKPNPPSKKYCRDW